MDNEMINAGFAVLAATPIVALAVQGWFFRKRRLLLATFVGALGVMAGTAPWFWYQTTIAGVIDPVVLHVANLVLHWVGVVIAVLMGLVFEIALGPYNRRVAGQGDEGVKMMSPEGKGRE